MEKWLSYLYPIKIEEASSAINESLEIVLVKGSLQLCTDRAVYSYEYKYENFRKLFELFDFSRLNGDQVLLLGLGLGSVIQLINHHKSNIRYTAIEIDEEVIYLAEKYILKNLNDDIQIINTNGHSYMQITEEKFDMICMDIFIDDWIPDEFLTKDFCELLKKALKPNGVVIYNTPAFSHKSSNTSRRFFKSHFKSVLP